MMPKAYSYIRMSTTEQRTGDSMRRQLAATDRFAASKGLEIAQRFDDQGVSGFRGRNAVIGALSHFLAKVESGGIERGSYLIVESMDRLTRADAFRALGLLSNIVELGITLVTLDDQKEYSQANIKRDNLSLIYALLSMNRAHEESKRKSALLGAVWANKKNNAREKLTPVTKIAPAWLRLKTDGTGFEEIPGRVEILTNIFNNLIDGKGAGRIARELTMSGLAPWGRSKVWNESYIKKIASYRSVLGEYQPHTYIEVDETGGLRRVPEGDPISNYYPQVISDGLYARARVAMKQRAITGRGRKGTHFRNPLTGLMTCRCGAGIRFLDKGKPPKGGLYLRCSLAIRKGDCTCPAFRFEVVLQVLMACVKQLDLRRFIVNNPSQDMSAKLSNEIQTLRAEVTDLSERAARLADAIATGTAHAPMAVLDAIRDAEKGVLTRDIRLRELEVEQNELIVGAIDQRKSNVQKIFEALVIDSDTAEQAHLRMRLNSELRALVKSIVLEPNDGPIPDGLPSNHRALKGVPWDALESRFRHLEGHLHFGLRINYRNGVFDLIEPLSGKVLSFEFSQKHQDMLLNSSTSLG